jgi:hypothetical protein
MKDKNFITESSGFNRLGYNSISSSLPCLHLLMTAVLSPVRAIRPADDIIRELIFINTVADECNYAVSHYIKFCLNRSTAPHNQLSLSKLIQCVFLFIKRKSGTCST